MYYRRTGPTSPRTLSPPYFVVSFTAQSRPSPIDNAARTYRRRLGLSSFELTLLLIGNSRTMNHSRFIVCPRRTAPVHVHVPRSFPTTIIIILRRCSTRRRRRRRRLRSCRLSTRTESRVSRPSSSSSSSLSTTPIRSISNRTAASCWLLAFPGCARRSTRSEASRARFDDAASWLCVARNTIRAWCRLLEHCGRAAAHTMPAVVSPRSRPLGDLRPPLRPRPRPRRRRRRYVAAASRGDVAHARAFTFAFVPPPPPQPPLPPPPPPSPLFPLPPPLSVSLPLSSLTSRDRQRRITIVIVRSMYLLASYLLPPLRHSRS